MRFWSFGPRSAVVRLGLGLRLDLPPLRRSEAQLGDDHIGGGSLVAAPSARVRDWNGTSRPGPVLAMPRPGDARVEAPGDRVVDDILRVGFVRHPQRDAQVGVGAQVVLDHAGRSLRGHDEVDAEGPAALGDVDDAVHELGNLAGERGELVDDEHESRRGFGIAPLLQLEEVLGLLAVEQMLAMVQLGTQARQRAAHQVRAEVGDEPDAVRQLDAIGERRAALVVDEEEGDAVGAVRGRHAEHPRLKELRLAGAGRPADEGVRSLRAQIERHRVRGTLPDDRAQTAGLLEARQLARRSGR